MSLHPSYHVSQSGKLTTFPEDQLDEDPRGLVCMWQPPQAGASYYMGVDPTVGVVDWSREFRTEGDYLTDNAAIEIIKRGKPGKPDRQVCEYAAPVHSEDLADYVNLLGRLYGLNEDDGQCPCIIEVYPGPGHMTQRRLINHFGYTNFFLWTLTGQMAPRSTGSLGWYSSPNSVRDLWERGLRHITRRGIDLKSQWLIEEMADCTPDFRAGGGVGYSAKGGRHDDRVRALLMAIWFAHQWELEVETEATREAGPGEHAMDPQASDMTSEEYGDWAEARFEELAADVE